MISLKPIGTLVISIDGAEAGAPPVASIPVLSGGTLINVSSNSATARIILTYPGLAHLLTGGLLGSGAGITGALTLTPGGGLPSWLASAAPLEIVNIPSSTPSGAAGLAPALAESMGTTGQAGMVNAWCGAWVYGGKFYIHGGGHSDYGGNETGVIDLTLDAPVWDLLAERTPVADLLGGSNYYNDGKPTARHTYYGMWPYNDAGTPKMLRLNGQMGMAFNGPPVGGTADVRTVNIDALNLLTGAWETAYGTMPRATGNDTPVAQHPDTGDIYVWRRNASGNLIDMFDVSAGTSSLQVTLTGTEGLGAAAVVDAVNGRLICFGGQASSNAVYWPLAGGAKTTLPLVGPAAAAVAALTNFGIGIAHDTLRNSVYLYAGTTIYHVDLDTLVATTVTPTGQTLNAPVNSWYGRVKYVPEIDAVVSLASWTSPVQVMRCNEILWVAHLLSGGLVGSGANLTGALVFTSNAAPLVVTGYPEWLNTLNLAMGAWGEVPTSNLSGTIPSPVPAGDPASRITAWTSFALDGRDSKLYSVCNGGHNDYAGNEVVLLDLGADVPVWVEIEPPSPASEYTENTGYYLDGKPSSRHTYYGVHVNYTDNRIMVMGGAPYANGGPGAFTGDAAAFNLLTQNYEVDGTIADIPASLNAGVAAYCRDPGTDDVYGFKSYNIEKWTRSTNSWSTLRSGTALWGLEACSAWDTRRNRAFILGGSDDEHHTYHPGTDTLTDQTLSGAEAASLVGVGGMGMLYAEALDAFLVRKSAAGGGVIKINASTFECTALATAGGESVPATDNGPYNKFLYAPALGVVAYAPSHTSNVWVLRTNIPWEPLWLTNLNLSVGDWGEIAGTNMSAVPPNPVPPGVSGPASKFIGWTSFAMMANKVYSVANGGHNDYSGNEVNMIDFSLPAPAWTELLAASPAGNVVQASEYYTDGKPTSRHSYYGMHPYVPENQIMMVGGYVYGATGAVNHALDAYQIGSNSYTAQGTFDSLPAGINDVDAACWSNPFTGDVFMAFDWDLYKWTRATNLWTKVIDASTGCYGREGAASAYDPTRGRAIIFDAGTSKVFTTDGTSFIERTLTGAEAANLIGVSKMTVVYIPPIDAFLVRRSAAGGVIYQVDAATFAVTLYTTANGESVPSTQNGPYNKLLYLPDYGVCTYLPAYTSNAWALRVAPTPAPGSFVAPYALPATGTAKAIGGNTFADLQPTENGFTLSNWNGSCFNSYGGGELVESFSVAGGFAIGFGSGGHNHARSDGGAVFDFAEGRWKRLDPTNTGAGYFPGDVDVTATSGSPDLEITAAPGVPAPAHPYTGRVSLTAAQVGNSKGGILYVMRGAATQSGNEGSSVPYLCAFNSDSSCTWSKFASTSTGRGQSNNNPVVLDTARNRIWVLPRNIEAFQNHHYLDLSDNTYKLTAGYPWPASNVGGAGSIFLYQGILFKPSVSDGFWAFDPDNDTVGWQAVPLIGTWGALGIDNRFEPYGGKFWGMPVGGGSTLTRLTPPVGDPITNAWTVDTLTVTGDTVPASVADGSAGTHFCAMTYVPSIDCLAWVPGGANPVVLIKPQAAFVAPYALPAAGTALTIAQVNDYNAIKPAAIATTGQWQDLVWRNYGTGTFIESYGNGGAYVAGAGGGGHTDGQCYGAAAFDFTDATWKRHDPTNTLATEYQDGANISEVGTSDTPHYEVTDSSGVPAATHLYGTQVALPNALGGGEMGSVLFVTRGAACSEARPSGGVHRGELGPGTITWSRYSEGTFSSVTDDSHAVVDPVRGRAYYLNKTSHTLTAVPYVDLSNQTVTASAAFTSPNADAARGHLFLHKNRYVVRIGANNKIFVFDPLNEANGLVSVTVSGTAPADRNSCWVPYEGGYYNIPNAGGSTINKLLPPADPINGTWTYSTVVVTGDTIPAHSAAVSHYTSLCYVPSINCLAWFSGANNAPVLIRPE